MEEAQDFVLRPKCVPSHLSALLRKADNMLHKSASETFLEQTKKQRAVRIHEADTVRMHSKTTSNFLPSTWISSADVKHTALHDTKNVTKSPSTK